MPKKEEKKIWISCRATEGCPGNYAVIVFKKSNNPSSDAKGSFQPEIGMGGSLVRYRCCTCGKSFHVQQ